MGQHGLRLLGQLRHLRFCWYVNLPLSRIDFDRRNYGGDSDSRASDSGTDAEPDAKPDVRTHVISYSGTDAEPDVRTHIISYSGKADAANMDVVCKRKSLRWWEYGVRGLRMVQQYWKRRHKSYT